MNVPIRVESDQKRQNQDIQHQPARALHGFSGTPAARPLERENLP